MSSIRIAIIGSRFSGVTACKACLEEGFDVIVYEKTDQMGGLWRYREEVVEGVGSVAKSTIINSCKEMAAFSDYPPPPSLPNYMHNTKMVQYLESYGKSFNFERYVLFSREVIKVEPNDDYDKSGKWVLTVKDLTNGQIIADVVNGVMVCSGHHGKPSVPTFKDQDKFKGRIFHTHSYRRPENFEDRKVVVVGTGNSGADAAVDLSRTAEQVYLSTRRGAWIGPRIGPNGKPFDVIAITRFVNLLMSCLPFSLVSTIFEFYFNFNFNHEEYGLKPEHRLLSSYTTVNDFLPNCILSGKVVVKPNIERFTENGVVFEGEKSETLCDAVVLATGYKISFPFISQSLVPTDKNRVQLYRQMFVPVLKHPKTLAFICLLQTQGGGYGTISEIQSQYFAQLMTNKLKLPNYETMVADIESEEVLRRKRFYDSERHTILVDWFPYKDWIATQLGVKPNLWKYFFTDFKLWKALLFGPSVSYQYRLRGPHSWSGAREAILTVNERMSAGLRTRPQSSTEEGESTWNWTLLIIILVIILSYLNIYSSN